MPRKDEILKIVSKTPGLTDREITDRIDGPGKPQQSVNAAARALVEQDLLKRTPRHDGLIGNYPTGMKDRQTRTKSDNSFGKGEKLSEDALKAALRDWLETKGYSTEIAWGKKQGIDIEAFGDLRWIIEVKGIGSLQAMRVNYFISILGETLQRMNDPNAKYSIALPDVPQFRRLWERLPRLAKSRTQISALFVDENGSVKEIS